MSGAGSTRWRARRLLAMSPSEIALRAMRAARESTRRRSEPLSQDQVATLLDVAAADADVRSDLSALRSLVASTRFTLLPGASDGRKLAELLVASGCPPDSTVTAADAILEGKLPAFGSTVIDTGRPIDWHLDPQTGRRWPLQHWSLLDFRSAGQLGDPRYVWEVNRQHHAVTLARAFVLSGDARYAREAWRDMRSWTEMNPPYFGVNWSSALELALRLISWASVIDLIGVQGAADDDIRSVFTSASLQADHVSDNLSVYASSRNNHLIGEAVGLLVAGTKFPFLKAARRWLDAGRRLAVREIVAQVFPDGASREQAFRYGTFVLEFALLVRSCLVAAGLPVDDELERCMSRMAGFILATGGPSGVPPSIGDDDGGMALCLSDGGRERQAMRAAVAAMSPGCALPRAALRSDMEAAAWLGVAGEAEQRPGASGAEMRVVGRSRSGPTTDDTPDEGAAQATAAWLSDSGYFVGGRGRHHGIVDCGPLGYLSIAAHGHADCLSVALAYDGLWYLVDPGTYCYHRDAEWRDHFRGTAAHNTVTVDGSDQSEMLGPFMWGRKARASATAAGVGAHFEFFEGRHDGYAKAAGVLHSRTVVFGAAGYWVVVDRLEGAGAHDVRCTFQFAPGFGLPSGDDLALSCDRFAVDMWSATPDGVSRSVVLGGESPSCGWVSEGFGQKEQAPAVRFGGRCNLPAEFMFVIVPEGRHRGLTVECSPSAGAACGAVEVGHEGGLDRLFLGSGDTREGRFEGRFGLVAERASGRELVGMDVAYWTDAGAEVDFLRVPNLIG